jgi:hypothetical protein
VAPVPLAVLLPKTSKPDIESGLVLLMIDNVTLMSAIMHLVQPEYASPELRADLLQTHL